MLSRAAADAHPFDYIVDLDKEARRFDPDGEYVCRWLPVLARLPTQYVHAPWTAPPAVLAAADVELGDNYPERIITAEVGGWCAWGAQLSCSVAMCENKKGVAHQSVWSGGSVRGESLIGGV